MSAIQKLLLKHHNKQDFRRLVRRLLWFVASAFSFAVLVLWIAFYLLDSPKEKMLLRENNQLKEELRALEKKMEMMDVVLKDIADRDDNIYRAIFEVDPLPIEERYPQIVENLHFNNLLHDDAMELVARTTQKSDQLIVRLAAQSRSLDTIQQLAQQKVEMLECIPAIRPLKNVTTISSGFGMRYHPIYKTLRRHTGIDMAAAKGTPVYATANGVVSREKSGSGYGITVIINHGYSYQSLYAHLSKRAVKPGERVVRGQIIGYVGNTGLSFGSHLHYEVLKNGRQVNPIHYFFNDITPQEYDQILESSKKINQALS